MKKPVALTFLTLALAAGLPRAASAIDFGDIDFSVDMKKAYYGVAMFNPNYKTSTNDHRSTGLVGRLGYDISKHFAVEAHVASTIGSEAAVDTAQGEMQMSNLYGAFLRANTQYGLGRIYILGGYAHGTRTVKFPQSSYEDDDSNKAFGFGAEISDDGMFGIGLEWIKYFDNRYYTVEAWNLGIVSRF